MTPEEEIFHGEDQSNHFCKVCGQHYWGEFDLQCDCSYEGD